MGITQDSNLQSPCNGGGARWMVVVPGEMGKLRQEYHQKAKLEKACLEEAG